MNFRSHFHVFSSKLLAIHSVSKIRGALEITSILGTLIKCMNTFGNLLVVMKVTSICASYNCGHKRLLCAMSLDCCYETACALRQNVQFISFDRLHNIYIVYLIQQRKYQYKVALFLKIASKAGHRGTLSKAEQKSWPII